MLCSCAEWSKGKSRVGWKLIRSREYAVPKDIILPKIMSREAKKSTPLQKPLLVCITIKVSVHKSKCMRLKVCFKSMYVPHVGQKMARHILIPRLNVVRVQKTTRPGHDLGFESCPQG